MADKSTRLSLKKILFQNLREAKQSYIRFKKACIERKMRETGLIVFATSPSAYSQATGIFSKDDPVLDESESGIPALRRHLYGLPADANYQSYYNHVFVTLPELIRQAEPIMEKHTEDESYATMRSELERDIPLLIQRLRTLGVSRVNGLITRLWSSTQAVDINRAIEQHINLMWVHREIRHPGFLKMLREVGMPINGKYAGHNWNNELLDLMQEYITGWHEKMKPHALQLLTDLAEHIKEFLRKLEAVIASTSVEATLKTRAMEALNNTSNRIAGCSNDFMIRLEADLRGTWLKFTTEDDIHCPIARIMRPIYAHALDPRVTGSGRGIYARQR